VSLVLSMNSDFDRADQNLSKSCSLIRCQTSVRLALITALATTEVEVGMVDVADIAYVMMIWQLADTDDSIALLSVP